MGSPSVREGILATVATVPLAPHVPHGREFAHRAGDPDTGAFVARFLDDARALAGPVLCVEIAALLAVALERGGDAWRPLHSRVGTIVGEALPGRMRSVPAHARMRAFVTENADLAEGARAGA